MVDGEIVIATARGSISTPAASPSSCGVARRQLAKESPAAFVAFDLLAADGRDRRRLPQSGAHLEELLRHWAALHLTPMTRDPGVAADWLERSKARASTA